MIYPFAQTAEPALAVGFIATHYRHQRHMGKGLITLAPATLDDTARAWRSAFPSIPGVALPGKDIAFCLALLLTSDGVYPCLPNSDGVCPCLPKWVILIWAMPG
jgi:hypothetical protein